MVEERIKPPTTSNGDKKTGTTEETKKYKIGVTQIVEHPSLNAAYDGFKKAIEDAGLNVEYDDTKSRRTTTVSI